MSFEKPRKAKRSLLVEVEPFSDERESLDSSAMERSHKKRKKDKKRRTLDVELSSAEEFNRVVQSPTKSSKKKRMGGESFEISYNGKDKRRRTLDVESSSAEEFNRVVQSPTKSSKKKRMGGESFEISYNGKDKKRRTLDVELSSGEEFNRVVQSPVKSSKKKRMGGERFELSYSEKDKKRRILDVESSSAEEFNRVVQSPVKSSKKKRMGGERFELSYSEKAKKHKASSQEEEEEEEVEVLKLESPLDSASQRRHHKSKKRSRIPDLEELSQEEYYSQKKEKRSRIPDLEELSQEEYYSPKKEKRSRIPDLEELSQEEYYSPKKEEDLPMLNLSDESPQKYNSEIDDNEDAVEWHKDELSHLLDTMKGFFDKGSIKAYLKEMDKTKWDEICEESNINKTGKQCAEKFRQLLSHTSKQRNFYELISACERKLPDLDVSGSGNLSKRFASSTMIFASRHKEEILKVIQEKKMNYFTACQHLFAKCPEKERLMIEKEMAHYRSLKENKKAQVARHRSQEKNSTPFMMYYNQHEGKCSDLQGLPRVNAARTKWDNLSDNKKLKYIKKSLAIMTDDNPTAEDETFKRLTKGETEMYLIKGMGMPLFPAINGYTLFLRNTPEVKTCGLSGGDMLNYMSKLWKKVSRKDKQEYVNNAKEKIKTFKDEFKSWENEQKPVTLALVKHLYKSKLETLFKPPVQRKRILYQLHTVERPMSRVSFYDAPIVPTKMTANSMYAEKQRLKGKPVKNASAEFKALPKAEQQKWKEMSIEIKEKFAKACLNYVRGLDEQQISLYLGFKRTKHIRHFDKDIFEDEYPVAKYPAYSNMKRDKNRSIRVMSQKTMEDELHKSFKDAGISDFDDNDEDLDDDDNLRSTETSTITRSRNAKLPNVKMASQLDSSTDSDSD